MVRLYFFSPRILNSRSARVPPLLALLICLVLILSGCPGSPSPLSEPEAPPVVKANAAQVAITTSSLPPGGVGATYSATLAAEGGVTPYTWSIPSGALPAGLRLKATTGAIAGVPTTSENSSFTVEVADSSSPARTTTAVLGVTITAVPSGSAASACGVLGTTGETYTLQNDVSSEGTCFSVQADNVTLNLNGYTITYNTASQSSARFAILGMACWDPDIFGIAGGNPCGGTFDNFTAYGGNIVEGSGAAASYAHAIRVGQGLNSGPTLHDLNITWSSDSAAGIYLDYAGAPVPGAAVIFNNTFYNRVTSIRSRVDIDGSSINLEQAEYNSVPAQIYSNTIIGGPQGGILSESIGAQIYGNTIQQGTVGSEQYTNDFAIYPWAQQQNVHDNVIQPTEGRGISMDASVIQTNGTIAANNVLAVMEKSNNPEYGGCALGGTYGIQYDDGASGASDQSNSVVANAAQCNAFGLRLTAYGNGNNSQNNSYAGRRQANASAGVVAAGLGLDSLGAPIFTATNDTFSGDTSSLYVDWDGAGPFTCVGCTLTSGSNPSNYVTFYFWNGGGPVLSGGLHFQDTRFQGEASKTSTNMSVPGSNGQSAEYWIDWTCTVTVLDSTGAPLGGATVTIYDHLSQLVFSGQTSANGMVSAVLSEFRMYSSGGSATQEMHTPHTVTISSLGCTDQTVSTTVQQTTAQTIQSTCQ
jgi:hypothetical protein